MIYEIKAIQFPIKFVKGLPSHFKIRFINLRLEKKKIFNLI